MLAGWVLMLAAVAMLSSLPARTAFCLAGFGVEILGFLLLARAYIPARKKSHA
jgi:hypothetical protein